MSTAIGKNPKKRTKKDKDSAQPLPGRASWAQGTKHDLLESRTSQWTDAQEAKKTNIFYTVTTQMIIQQYGFDLPYDQDGPILTKASESTCASVMTFPEEMAESEKQKRTDFFWGLRTKVGNWYRHRMKAMGNNRVRTQVQEILEAFNAMSQIRPSKDKPKSLYSRQHYQTRIKPIVEREWNALTEEEREVPGARLQLSNAVTTKSWKAETEAFRKAIEDECEETYREAMEDYKNGKSWTPRTAEEYHKAIEEAHVILLPFVDALTQYYGTSVSILLCGPMSRGEIEVKR
ncbi:hypothetical protein H0H92_011960 [Tricholoma furcatifolium]|nr:hypothetical protein H0H92_011960 [Tricholoma furcatifolium]